MRHNTLNQNAARGEGQSHIRYIEPVKFFNGLADIAAGEVLEITKPLGKGAAWVRRANGDTWAEIGIDGKRAEYFTPAKPLTKTAAIRAINTDFPDMIARATDCGEVRVTFRAGTVEAREAAAYYTDDAQDAYDTAKAMATASKPAPVKPGPIFYFERGAGHGADAAPDLIGVYVFNVGQVNPTCQAVVRISPDCPYTCSRETGLSMQFPQTGPSVFRHLRAIARIIRAHCGAAI